MRKLASTLGIGLAVTLTGCLEFGKKDDAKVPGESLGSFHVVAALEASTCGPGALGSEDVWEFDVQLSRDGDDLYWLNGREAIPGTVAGDGVTFAFDSHVLVEAVPAAKGKPACVIARSDSGSGQLAASGNDVPAFEGLLRYGFAPTQGSDCQELVGVAGGFYALPCEMSYAMTGARTSAE